MSEGGIEAVGYMAMAFVALSIAMKDDKKLRVFNLTGAICFVVYGLLIESYPVLILNALLTALNGYHLFKMKKEDA